MEKNIKIKLAALLRMIRFTGSNANEYRLLLNLINIRHNCKACQTYDGKRNFNLANSPLAKMENLQVPRKFFSVWVIATLWFVSIFFKALLMSG